jgi:hypothetical protein
VLEATGTPAFIVPQIEQAGVSVNSVPRKF